jgi:hypothetical protein
MKMMMIMMFAVLIHQLAVDEGFDIWRAPNRIHIQPKVPGLYAVYACL